LTDTGLSGRLADFNLEEILQLIALQQKTGLLRVDASYPISLYFEQGLLVSYRDRRSASADPLEVFLKRYGFFPASSWEHVDFVQRNSDLDLTEILVNEGLLSSEELAAAQTEAAQEHLFNGMQLRDGRYQFLSGRANLNGIKGRVSLKADGLLMEAVRRIDEMPTLREKYQNGEMKIRRSEEEIDVERLSPGVRRLLGLLDRERAVHALVAGGKMSEFDVYTTLEAMREMRLITLQASTAGAGHEASERTAREKYLGATPRGLSFALVMLSLATLTVAMKMSPLLRPERNQPRGSAARWVDSVARAAIEAQLEIFRSGHGRYPQGEEQLLADGLSEAGLFEGYAYLASGDGRSYRLERIED
jgi:hypothetical protein